MIDKGLKALFSFILGAMALLYVIHNVANIDAAQSFFAFVTSHADQEAYPVTLLPVPTAALVSLAMALVFALEAAAGVLLIYGAVAMIRARRYESAFARGTKLAKLGIGCAVANWWGLFQVVAGAGYQMWQVPAARDPFYSSLLFGAMYVLLLVVLNQRHASD